MNDESWHVSDAEIGALRSEFGALRSIIEDQTRAQSQMSTNLAVNTEVMKSLKETVDKLQADSVTKEAHDALKGRVFKLESTFSRINWILITGVLGAALALLLGVKAGAVL